MPGFISSIGQALAPTSNSWMPMIAGFAALLLGGLSRKSQSDGFARQSRGILTTIREPVAPWQIIYGKRRVSGVITFIEIQNYGDEESGRNGFMHMIVTWAGHPCQAIDQIFFDDEEIVVNGDGSVQGRLADRVRILHSLGNESGQPFPSLVAESFGKWTNAHRQSGRCKSYFRMQFDPEKFATGLPNMTAVIRGVNDVHDPRTGTSGYSTNAALCRAHYITNSAFGLGADRDEEIDQDQLEASANEADEAVALDAGGTEPRYTLNGFFDASETHEDVLLRMNAASAGRTIHVGATWQIMVGAYEAPTLELTERDLAGPVRIQGLVSRAENFNSVISKWTNPNDRWQPVDTPPLESDAYITQDNEEQVWSSGDYTSFVTSGTQAQRLQKIELQRVRQGLTAEAQWKLKALRALTGKSVALTIAKYGWSAKAFEVVGFKFEVQKSDGRSNAPRLVVRLALRETAAAVYDWSVSEEQAQDPAPNSNLPDPFNAPVPGAPVVTESLYSTRVSAGVKTKVTITWEAPFDGFPLEYILRYKLAASSTYNELGPVRTRTIEILDIAPGVYDFEVKQINVFGVSSAWSTTRKEIVGLAADPADITGLSIQAAGGLAIFRWDLHPDADVREGGGILARHSEATNPDLASWEESFSIGERIAGNTNQVALPLKPGTYLFRAIDSSEKLSPNPAKISTKQASILNFVDVDLVQEDATFPGTHDGTIGIDGALKILAGGLLDAQPDFDTIANFDSFGGVEAFGTYAFDTGLDLGSVQRVRLTSQLEGLITNVNDMIDLRPGNIDDWANFDGTEGADADAYVEVRETDDDPASSPDWSGWKRLDAAEFQARGFEFRAQLLTGDDSYNVLVTKLRVAAAQIY